MTQPLALNPFKKGKKTEVEGIRKVDVGGDSELEKAIKQYESFQDNGSFIDYCKNYSKAVKIILSPAKIYYFLDYLISADKILECRYDDHDITGLYISKLIQDSYNAGHNNFVLNTNSILINQLGDGLKALEDRRLELTIDGDVKHFFGQYSINTDFIVNGIAYSHLGRKAENSHFIVQNNVTTFCGINSRHSVFTIKGNVGEYCGGESRDSEFNISHNALIECGSKSIRSQFTIMGDVEEDCGYQAKYSNFTVHGNAKRNLGMDSSNSNFTVHNGVGDDCGYNSKKSVFTINGNVGKRFAMSSNYSTYNITNLIHNFTQEELCNIDDSNKVQLLDLTGKVIFSNEKISLFERIKRYFRK